MLPPSDPLNSTLYADWVRHFDPGAFSSAEALASALRDEFRKTHKPGAFVDDVSWRARALPERHRPWLWDMVGHWLSANTTASSRDSRYRTAAISAYGLARAAEREHSLPVHVDYHRANTLLFARAGALPVKEVAIHQRWLSGLGSAHEAHDAFVRLLVALAQGGASLGADLHRRVRASAKAAGLGPAADSEVLRDVLVACTSQKVPDGLLDGAAKVFASAPPQDVAPLLSVFPATVTDGSALLRMLDAAGAIEGLAAGTLEPPAGLAQWFSQFFFMYCYVEVPYGGVTAQQMPRELFDMIERVGPRLKDAGHPVSMAHGRFGHAHLDTDLADALLAVGADVEGPAGGRMRFWGKDSRRDLIALAADPVLGPRLESTVHADSRTTSSAIVRLPDNPGIERSVFARIVALVERVASGGLLDAERALAELDELLDLPTVQALDGIEEALAVLDGVGPLLRTLRAGVPSELHWPAWEAAIGDLGSARGVTATWPMLTLYNRKRAVVIGPHTTVAETELTIPAGTHLRVVFYAGGDFLVGYSDTKVSYPKRAFWTSALHEEFEPTDWYGMTACRSREYDGLGYHFATHDGRHDGRRILRSGDRHGVAGHLCQMSDGERVWRFEGQQTRLDSWAEVDPISGVPTETSSLPAFFTDGDIPEGKIIASSSLSYARLPEGVTSSPLGSAAGVSGFRILRDRRDHSGWVVESVDGRRATFAGGSGVDSPWGLVRFPQRDIDLVMTCGCVAGSDSFASIRAHDGDSPLWDVPTEPRDRAAFPPPAFWHFLAPRDPSGSAALRELDAADVRALLTDDVVPSGITDPILADGVRAQAATAARLIAARERLSQRVATIRSGVLVTAPASAPDSELLPALLGLLDHHPNAYSTVVAATVTGLAADGSYLAGNIDDTVRRMSPPAPPVDWTPLLGHIDAVIRRAINGRTPESDRLALIALLRTWAAQPFAVPGEWRVGRWQPTAPTPERTLLSGGSFVQPAAVEPPADATDIRAVVVDRDDAARIERLLDLLSENGPRVPGEKAVRRFLELTGVREPIARLVLDGLPRRRGFGGGPSVLYAAHDKMVRTKPYRADSLVAELYEEYTRKLGWAGRYRLLAAGVPEDVSELWTEDGDLAAAERMAAVWNELLGRRLYVSEQLIGDLEADTGLAYAFALALTHPQRATVATENLRCHLRVSGNGWLEIRHNSMAVAPFRRWNPYRELATALMWGLTERPVGDPEVRGIIELHDRLRARLQAPGLLVELSSGRFPAELFGPETHAVSTEDRMVYDNGLIIVDEHDWRRSTFLRPAALGDPDTLARSLRICADHGLTELDHAIRCEAILLSGVAALVERAATTPVAAGRYEADPQHSVPDLVERVSATIGTSPDAAALYLQLLTLARPTDRAVRRFNNWTPARHKKAQAELVAGQLVVEDKRARAGRTAFIPGPWTAKMPSPHLPLETAKLDRHLVRIENKSIIGPFTALLPPRPLHEMFADAWFARNA
ncbi:hypothetical protein FNL39_1075 [Nocardia caishijiensis]|uniref:Uncharacterized protein n=2 Tax=Nocardia caishijiensis TaxID=184756 RepID=A0ABQ6YIT3_9NOCA|nr:hypothetical protein FNL39_1075 [Nocardia caishijiensis]